MERAFILSLLVGTCVSLFPFPYIDVLEELPECPSPWFRVGSQCFLRVGPGNHWSEARNWTSARVYCGDQAPRADLAQPEDIKALADYLVDAGYDRRFQHYWTGGSDSATEGEYLWLNGTNITTDIKYQGWTRTHYDGGDQDCLSVWIGEGSESVSFYDKGCEEKWIILCERH